MPPDQNCRCGSVSRGLDIDAERLSVGAVSADAARPVEDADRGVGIAADLDRRPDKMPAQWGGLELELETLEANRVVAIDDAFLLLAENLVEIGAGPGDKCGSGLARLDHEGAVVSRQIGLEDKPVRRLD